MTRPRITTIFSAALSSAAAFFVLTRSGLAGTLAGAAVASMVYTGTSHWAGQGLERAARWWLSRRGGEPESDGLPPSAAARAGHAEAGDAGAKGAANDFVATVPADKPKTRGVWTPGRLARTWGPVALAVAALGVSAFSLVTGSPLERVIVQERVVEKPVERVVVQTVTVTVPGSGGEQAGATTSSTSSDGTSTGTSTTTSAPVSTTTTTTSTTTTPSTTAPPPTTTTTALPPTTTTTVVPAGG